MAIDTAQKRAALLNFVSPFPYILAQAGDGTIDAIDRGALAGIYVYTVEAPPPSSSSCFMSLTGAGR
jgi:hypothetical protein